MNAFSITATISLFSVLSGCAINPASVISNSTVKTSFGEVFYVDKIYDNKPAHFYTGKPVTHKREVRVVTQNGSSFVVIIGKELGAVLPEGNSNFSFIILSDYDIHTQETNFSTYSFRLLSNGTSNEDGITWSNYSICAGHEPNDKCLRSWKITAGDIFKLKK